MTRESAQKKPTDGMDGSERSKSSKCLSVTVTEAVANGHGSTLSLKFDAGVQIPKNTQGWVSGVKDSAFKIESDLETNMTGHAVARTAFAVQPDVFPTSAAGVLDCDLGPGAKVDARILGRQDADGGVQLLLAAGRAQGVVNGQTGKFKDGEKLVGSFKIELVSDTVCRATTKEPHNEVKKFQSVVIGA